MRLSENVEGNVELNQNTLCVYGLSKECNTGIAEYINLKNLGNDKGDDQRGKICILPILLQLPPLLLPHYSIYDIKWKFELNQNTLSAYALSKKNILRIDLELLENAYRGRSSHQKAICAHNC